MSALEILSLCLVKPLWGTERQLQFALVQIKWKQDLCITEQNSQCSPPVTSNSDRIHSKIQGKHKKNTLASDHSRKKLFSTAGGRACKAQFLFPNFWQHLHNLYISFHGERAEERRWPNQEQESDKAGTKWWLTSLASETRKWACPSQTIYLGAKYHLCNSFICRSCQTWSPCEPVLF